jgi:RNA polymerase sigma-70 factor, ECF subfamily
MDDSSPVTLPITDEQLMLRLAQGDRSALAGLVERHQDRVLRLAYRHTQRWDVAEDIAQDSFVRIWRTASSYRPSAAFTTWLYRIVVNLCLDWHKRRRGVYLSEGMEPSSESRDEQQEVVQRVQQAIGALPERQRMVLLLHRFEGLSHREVASATGWSESAVESLLVRAYSALRDRLAEEK